MNQIQQFSNPQFGDIRIVITEDNEPMFCLKDLCEALNLTNNRKVKSQLDQDVTLSYPLETNGGIQQTTFVTEAGMYTVILRSDSPKAKPMQKWVTSEVLPSIRKHGAYMTNETLEKAILSPDFLIQLATSLKDEQSKRIAAEKQLEKLQPKAALMDKILDSGEKIDIGQTAKILGLPFGRNTLFKKLRERGIFFKNRNEPKQEYLDRNYFELKEQWIERNNHDGFAIVKVLVTQKGLAYINKLLGGNNSEPKQAKEAYSTQ